MVQVLKESHFAYLCTTDRRNQPHVTPMFFIFDEETRDIFVVTSLRSKKMSNIRVNPQVSLTVDVRDPENPFNNRGVMVQGEAVVEKPLNSLSAVQDKELLRVYSAFQKKYPILASQPQDTSRIEYRGFSEALVRVYARKMVYWRGHSFITVDFKHKFKTRQPKL